MYMGIKVIDNSAVYSKLTNNKENIKKSHCWIFVRRTHRFIKVDILTHWDRDTMADIFQTTYLKAVSWINLHPVMSSDLHGPPVEPRRAGTVIFKCVGFLVQLKYKNSSYWLSHITTALNCKMCSIYSKYTLCHARKMFKKFMGENVKIYIYFSDKWK